MLQIFYLYPQKDFITTELVLVGRNGGATQSRYMAPIVTAVSNTFLPSSGDNRMYDMPWDNDGWVAYNAQPWALGQTLTSCEVSAFYDVVSRRGLVVGSIEHETWKTGVEASLAGSNRLRSLRVYGGYVSARTQDVRPDLNSVVNRHGAVVGSQVKSPRVFLGSFADWRNGLEALGEATATLRPKLKWDKGTMFGWQSWGGMAEKVNYQGVMDVGRFYANSLMQAHFHNENNTQWLVLDSYWSNLNDDQLRDFVAQCHANGQHAGIYTTPFSYWGSEQQAQSQVVEGTPYKYADLLLKGDGKVRKIVSLSLDPTHPGTREMNRRLFERVKALGFEYIKLDFLNSGALEADKFYEPSVTTGMQAYNYGMNYIIQMAGDMFIDLSIAPVFPAVGHARRISCDSWGERNFSQYTLNNIGMGWWLDRIYVFNDPDHIVLQRSEDDLAAKVRYTSAVLAGMVLIGDNLSLEGTFPGKQEYRDRVLKIATNEAVNAVGRVGRSFRTVSGGLSANTFNLWDKSYAVDNEYILETPDAVYYAVFNFKTDATLSHTALWERLGIDAGQVSSITELWTGRHINSNATGFSDEIAPGDVCLYKISRNTAGIRSTSVSSQLSLSKSNGHLNIAAPMSISTLRVVDLLGHTHYSAAPKSNNISVDTTTWSRGCYVAQAKLVTGEMLTEKILF